MDRVTVYRQYIQQLLQAKANRSMQSSKEVEAQTIFDVERDRYQLVYVGWKRNGIRDYGCLLHLDIKDGKIWIQYDGTEDGIAYELLKLGVPNQDIVLGFQPARVRSDTEFAVG
ncbi:XisI protein [Tumidithrix helvetica PCC 7403]|uniref:XisI protein n=1 Tax=Tumidithrix helvetica TaxID=3457545 RepID=UPI003C871210